MLRLIILIPIILLGCLSNPEEKVIVSNEPKATYEIIWADGNLDTLDFQLQVEIESIICPVPESDFLMDVSGDYQLVKGYLLVPVNKRDCLLKITYKYKE